MTLSAASDASNATRVRIAANFTIEPIEQVLTFWLAQLGISADIQFAPYNQVFQQLLEGGLLRTNRNGINLIGLDLDGWLVDGPFDEASAQLKKTVAELLSVLRSASSQGVSGAVLLFPSTSSSKTTQVAEKVVATSDLKGHSFSCAEQPANSSFPSGALANEGDALPPFLPAASSVDRVSALLEVREFFLTECASIHGWSAFDLNQAVSLYSVRETHDPFSNELGHIPFTEEMYTAAATVAARWIRSIRTKPRKVIVLDCDNTLWQGICGEGPVQVTQPYRNLHDFMMRQRDEGVLLAIASKNNEAEVMAVLESADSALKPDHFTSWQINWQPKSDNLRAISEELGLALNTFLFLDDSPYECLEVRNSYPEVLAVTMPREPETIPVFLEHLWAFDRPAATEEDRNRAGMYQAEKQRADLSRRALTREEFLANLQIQIQVARATEAELPRVAQLTQRTTQFNMTGVQHTTQSLATRLSQGDCECWTVRVSDVFGDYGLVGAIIFDTADNLRVDTFLLSCRALGRGVEDRMMDDLKLWAAERGAESVVIPFVPTSRNRPALEFLGRYCEAPTDARDSFECVLSASGGASQWRPAVVATKSVEAPLKSVVAPTTTIDEADLLTRIASKLQTSEEVLKAVRARKTAGPAGAEDYIEPREELEKTLAAIWSDCLLVEPVGVRDNFGDLGGTSLIAALILARVHSELGVKLTLADFFGHRTVQQMAAHISTVTVQAPGAAVALSTRASVSSTGST